MYGVQCRKVPYSICTTSAALNLSRDQTDTPVQSHQRRNNVIRLPITRIYRLTFNSVDVLPQ